MDLLTYRYPRTREQAFGFGREHHITQVAEPMSRQDKIVTIACALAALALAVILIVEVLP